MTISFLVKNLAALVTFGAFFWGASKFFIVKDEGAKKGKLIITSLGLPATLINLYFVYATRGTTQWQDLAAIVLYLVATWVFFASVTASKTSNLSFAFSEQGPSGVVKNGPYKIVRHPFYTSYTLAWIAGFAGTGNYILLAVAIIMFAIYWKSASHEENVILNSSLQNDYKEYKNQTGMFLPKIK